MEMQIEEILKILEQLVPGISSHIEEKANYFAIPTICHNIRIEDCNTKKLILYKESRLFTCFTDCSETFNIYTLIKKRNQLTGGKFFIGGADDAEMPVQNTRTRERIAKRNTELIVLQEYSENILQAFQKPTHLNQWFLEGISIATLEKFGIMQFPLRNWVVILHRDYRGRLVGVRRRTYDEVEIPYGKYTPATIGDVMYNHSLGCNFFGIDQNLGDILITGTLILAEAEKSVCQAEEMLEYNNVLALCGSSITTEQIKIIRKILKPQRIILALDREYQTPQEMWEWVEKQREKSSIKFLKEFYEVYILLDEVGRFAYKESPFDRTIECYKSMRIYRL